MRRPSFVSSAGLSITAPLLAAMFFGYVPNALAADGWQIPEALEDRVSVLDRRARRFVSSGAALDYLPARQLEHEIATRDAEALEAFVDDLMGVAEQMGYDADRDMGAMPLNTEARGYNRTVPRMILDGIERTPGPFSVHRYMFPETGVPTFAGAPVAIYPEDLIAGDVDVAIVGIPSDMGSGRRNAEYGPRAMRVMNSLDEPDVYTLVDPMEVLSVVDYGDFATDYLSAEITSRHVVEMVAETAGTGAVPMMVGGDTSMLYPGVTGVAEVHGRGSFGLVHFSAHADAEREAVHTLSDTQAVFMLLDEGIVDGEDLIQVGLRGKDIDVETLQWLRDQGVRYHTMAEVSRTGFDAVLERVLDEAMAGPEKLFVSIDVSVIEPTEMVSAGRIASNGLRIQQAAAAIRYLCAARELVGFEITDMSPMLDFSRLSAVNANTILNACLVGVAARAAGYGPEDVHPLAIDHGQD